MIGCKSISENSEYSSDDFPSEKRYVFDTDKVSRLITERGRINFDNKAAIKKYDCG